MADLNYLWEKYYTRTVTKTRYKTVKKLEFISTQDIDNGGDSFRLWDSYYFNSNTGELRVAGGQFWQGWYEGRKTGYEVIGNRLITYKPYGTGSRRDQLFITKTTRELQSETIPEDYTVKEKGTFLSNITSSNRSAYPDDGIIGNYWYVYKGIDNQAPTISGSNLDLGSKVDDFEIEYVVTDADGDSCTVDILVDNIKKVSSKSVSLGIKNTYSVNLNDFTLGRHTVKIVAKDSKGASSERIYTFSKSNTAPEIDGENEDLGGKSTAFTIDYRVTDRNNDDISVVVTLDDLEISNVTSAQNKDLSVTITDEQLQTFEIGSTHTITIKADDGKGGVAYRRYTFTKVNRPPIISGSDTNLGDKKETFKVDYTLTDTEKDQIYCKVYLDNRVVIEDLEVVDSNAYSYTIPQQDFIELTYGEHKLIIEAWDNKNVDNKQYRVYTFKRVSNGLEVEIKINEFTVQPKKVIGVPHGVFAEDSILKVYACNNYLDEEPTWEEITTESKAARAFAFTNSTKTSDKWAIGLKIIIENGPSEVSSVLRGTKGGYE